MSCILSGGPQSLATSLVLGYTDIKSNNFLERLIEKEKRNEGWRTGNGLPTVPFPFSNWNRMKGFLMAVDRHNLWSSLDFRLCGKQPIPVSPELKLYAYKSCLSDYTHVCTHTPFSLHIYCSIVALSLILTVCKDNACQVSLFALWYVTMQKMMRECIRSQINSLSHLLSLSQLEKQRLLQPEWCYNKVTNMNRNQNTYAL